MEKLEGLGKRIKALRIKNKWTQKEFAHKLNVSSQVVSNWEREYSFPDMDDVVKISNVFNVSIGFILTGEDTIYNSVGKIDLANQFLIEEVNIEDIFSENEEVKFYFKNKKVDKNDIKLFLKLFEVIIENKE